MRTLGHDSTRERFRRTLERGRLASTYLFVGPEGIGKRTFALELAEALLCQSPVAATRLEPCAACESCRLMATGDHPDLLQITRPAGKASLPLDIFIGRPDHRNREGLCHEISLKPYLATRRIALIDDADHLGVESANALLKTLEEPPPRSLLILIGTSLSKQLPTIRSRSQVVRFEPLSAAVVERVLLEKGLVDEGRDAASLAATGRGSVTQAVAAADEQLAAFGSGLSRTLDGGGFDPIRLSETIIDETKSAGTEPAARRRRLRAIIEHAIDHCRRRLREAVTTGAAAVDADPWIGRLEHSLSAAEALDRNANQATLVQTWLTDVATGRPPIVGGRRD